MYKQALEHFKKVDPLLYDVASKINLAEIEAATPDKYFEHLCESIVSQQLSIKVADVIWGRVLELFPKKKISPKSIIDTDHEILRICGLSNAKATYIRDLAIKTNEGSIKFDQFNALSENEIASELIKVKGIGPWTAEMFLIFTMGNPDVFSVGDLGLKNAIAKLYTKAPNPQIWSPFRSYACRVLWKSLEIK